MLCSTLSLIEIKVQKLTRRAPIVMLIALYSNRSRHMPLDLSDFQPTDDLAQAQTMPSRWYTDPAILELEKQRIFWKTWQPVGCTEMVARVGDFFPCEIAGEPLVVTRAQDGVLRAFYN